MKRRSVTARKLRDRRGAGLQSPYAKYDKVPYRYSWQAPWRTSNRLVTQRHVRAAHNTQEDRS